MFFIVKERIQAIVPFTSPSASTARALPNAQRAASDGQQGRAE